MKIQVALTPDNQAEGPGSQADLIQGTEDTAADKHSALGVACEYR